MQRSGALLAVCFVAGMLGALIAGLFIWGCNHWGVTDFLKVNLSQSLELKQLYQPMFIGGLWGLLYFFTVGTPRQRRQWIRKGLWFSLVPAAFALFYLYPYVQQKGLGGFQLGNLTPLLVIAANLVWGFFTGFFTRLLWGR